MRKIIIITLLVFAFCLNLSGQEVPVLWYRSNASGMALQQIPSRIAALRHEHALSVVAIPQGQLPGMLPELLRPYYEGNLRVELRTLHENGEESRRQWIFRDARGINRVLAAGTGPLFGVIAPVAAPAVEEAPPAPPAVAPAVEEAPPAQDSPPEGPAPEDPSLEPPAPPAPAPEPRSSGFIEIRNSEGTVQREIQINEDSSEWEFRYTYRDGMLLRTETWFREGTSVSVPDYIEDNTEVYMEDGIIMEDAIILIETPTIRAEPVYGLVYTDIYSYSRTGSIRSIDRRFYDDLRDTSRISFPGIGPVISLPREELPIHGGSYTADYFRSGHGVQVLDGMTISYTLDTRGRVLTEIWRDDDGIVIGELRNTWSGDRLQSVLWIEAGDEQLVEFEYDNRGNRTIERNLRNGVLERVVITEDDTDIEELYMNGRLILRARWQDGVRVSEERIR